MAREIDILIVAVTRLSDGVCIAGLTGNNTWIRPTRENTRGWRQLEINDLKDVRGQVVVKAGNVVRWSIGKPIPRDVHVEDHLVGNQPPQLVQTLQPNDLDDRLKSVATDDLTGFLRSADNSLAIIRPASVASITFRQGGKGGITAEMEFSHAGTTYGPYKITDLAWRALGRRLLQQAKADYLPLSPNRFRASTGMRPEYLAIGRAQKYQGEYWPLIISVLTEPLNEEPIDYLNP